MTPEFLAKEVQRLITEGQQVADTKFDAGKRGVHYLGARPTGVDLRAFSRWQAGCKNLMRLLADCAEPWKETFNGHNSASTVTQMLGTLEAIQHAISEGLLIHMQDLVRAESFISLL